MLMEGIKRIFCKFAIGKTLMLTMAVFSLAMTVQAQYIKKESIRIWSDVDARNMRVTLTPYLPVHNDRGIAVIVCPGGSYFWLDPKNESIKVGKWLAENGIAAFVLKYRTATIGGFITHWRTPFGGARYPDMLQDVQRAHMIVRENASAWNINPERVGAMGFSAGGHLVALAAERAGDNFLRLRGVDVNCSFSPDFVAAIYPVVTLSHPQYTHRRSRRGLLGERDAYSAEMRDSLSLEKNVSAGMPPVFIVNCMDDPVVDYHNGMMLDSALTDAGVNHKYIRYEKGGHGFGASSTKGSAESRQWRAEFIKWLKDIYHD